MKKKTYTRTLKLGPAIGDWTKIQFQDPSLSEVQITEVKDINFDSLPKEDMKELHLLHYRLSERLAASMAKDLDIKVELHTISAAQMTYKEFVDSQTEKLVQADYIISNVGRVNVLFDWALADMIVNRLTGGKGDQHEGYHFSDIESAILESQMDALKTEFASIWEESFSIDQLGMSFSYGDYVYDKKFSLREAYIVFTFNLYFGKGDLTKVSWAYPNHVLRYLLTAHRKKAKTLRSRVTLTPKTLSGIKVPIRAELGKATLKMGDLKSLQVGDVIPLDTPFNKPLEFLLGKTVTLMSQPGVFNDHVGLQLLVANQKAGSFSIKRDAPEAFPISAKADKAPKSAQVIPSIIQSSVEEPKVADVITEDLSLDESLSGSATTTSYDDFEKNEPVSDLSTPLLDDEDLLDPQSLESVNVAQNTGSDFGADDLFEESSDLDLNNLTMQSHQPGEDDILEETALGDEISQNDELEDINIDSFSSPEVKKTEPADSLDTELDFDDDFSWDDLDEDL